MAERWLVKVILDPHGPPPSPFHALCAEKTVEAAVRAVLGELGVTPLDAAEVSTTPTAEEYEARGRAAAAHAEELRRYLAMRRFRGAERVEEGNDAK